MPALTLALVFGSWFLLLGLTLVNFMVWSRRLQDRDA